MGKINRESEAVSIPPITDEKRAAACGTQLGPRFSRSVFPSHRSGVPLVTRKGRLAVREDVLERVVTDALFRPTHPKRRDLFWPVKCDRQ